MGLFPWRSQGSMSKFQACKVWVLSPRLELTMQLLPHYCSSLSQNQLRSKEQRNALLTLRRGKRLQRFLLFATATLQFSYQPPHDIVSFKHNHKHNNSNNSFHLWGSHSVPDTARNAFYGFTKLIFTITI